MRISKNADDISRHGLTRDNVPTPETVRTALTKIVQEGIDRGMSEAEIGELVRMVGGGERG